MYFLSGAVGVSLASTLGLGVPTGERGHPTPVLKNSLV